MAAVDDGAARPDRPGSDDGTPSLGSRIASALVGRMIVRTLRSDFRRLVWIGDEAWRDGTLDARRPLVLYTNHHAFHDGYFLYWLVRELGRTPILWMNEWERVPLFGPLGVLPFPPDDRRQRLATIRETARRLRRPGRAFLYFPEGTLGPPDAGVADFPPDAFARLARLFPDATQWWPVGIRVTWWGEDRPTALFRGGAPHDAPTGDERRRLADLVDALKDARPGDGRVFLDGRASAHERWDLSRFAPIFRRWT